MGRFFAFVLVCAGMIVAGGAWAQGAKDLVGAWTLVALYVEQGDKKVEPYGASPFGALHFEANGRFSVIITRKDLPKFASNNRETGTDDENKAVVKGSIAYCGTYTVSDADHSVTVRVEGVTFPNWVGISQKRVFALAGDELTITNPTPSAGGGVAKQVWKRAR